MVDSNRQSFLTAFLAPTLVLLLLLTCQHLMTRAHPELHSDHVGGCCAHTLSLRKVLPPWLRCAVTGRSSPTVAVLAPVHREKSSRCGSGLLSYIAVSESSATPKSCIHLLQHTPLFPFEWPLSPTGTRRTSSPRGYRTDSLTAAPAAPDRSSATRVSGGCCTTTYC